MLFSAAVFITFSLFSWWSIYVAGNYEWRWGKGGSFQVLIGISFLLTVVMGIGAAIGLHFGGRNNLSGVLAFAIGALMAGTVASLPDRLGLPGWSYLIIALVASAAFCFVIQLMLGQPANKSSNTDTSDAGSG